MQDHLVGRGQGRQRVEGVRGCWPGVQPLAKVVCAEPDADDDVPRHRDIDIEGHHAFLHAMKVLASDATQDTPRLVKQ